MRMNPLLYSWASGDRRIQGGGLYTGTVVVIHKTISIRCSGGARARVSMHHTYKGLDLSILKGACENGEVLLDNLLRGTRSWQSQVTIGGRKKRGACFGHLVLSQPIGAVVGRFGFKLGVVILKKDKTAHLFKLNARHRILNSLAEVESP